MLRSVFTVATLISILPGGLVRQELGVLRVTIALADSTERATPVARYALLVSDNPASAAPRRILTGLDGSVEIRLRPGSYMVESDRPFVFESKAYEWTEVIEIAAGRETVVELGPKNARVASVGPEADGAARTAPEELDPSAIISQWQDSVVGLWTPTAHASGFVIDARGLIVTGQRSVGTAATVEVQLTPSVKVAANVLVADAAQGVAVLRFNPATAAIRPLPLGCGEPPRPVRTGQEVVAIEAPLRQQKGTTSGRVTSVLPRTLQADLGLAAGGAGGPVFDREGRFVGLTSLADERTTQITDDIPIVRNGTVCAVVASLEKSVDDGKPPGASLLPLEPLKRFPESALAEAATKRAGSLNTYQTASSDFDITFLTPVLVYAGQDRPRPLGQPGRSRGARPVEVAPIISSPLLEFSNWSAYVSEVLPVLLVRVTPKFVEGFWTRVGRGAALAKGIPIPPIKRYRPGFSSMRVFCGEKEVTPIHPFKLERRVSETDAIYEGLYVLDPGALSPECGSVKLELYSEKAPETGVPHVVEPGVIARVWQDFAPYRTQ
jgi:hypothetical protein